MTYHLLLNLNLVVLEVLEDVFADMLDVYIWFSCIKSYHISYLIINIMLTVFDR